MKKPALSELTLREKVGQMISLCPENIIRAGVENVEEFMKNNPFGSMWVAAHMNMSFLNEFNSETDELIKNDSSGMINVAYEDAGPDYNRDLKFKAFKEKYTKTYKAPLLLSLDVEAGLKSTYAYYSTIPVPTAVGATNDPEYAYKYGKAVAHETKISGVEWVWSPVADNPSPFASSSLGRAYSSDVEYATKMVLANIKGIQSENVAAGVKHFPGSDKYEYRDTHISGGILRQNYDEWYERQGKIFEAAINDGVYSIMIKHLCFPAVDDTIVNGRYLPSTLSKKVITDLLKGKFGFKGVVITDSIEMRAVRSAYPDTTDMLVALVNAGNDVLLGYRGIDAIDVIEQAVIDGRIAMERIDDACQRILDMKEKLGMFDEQPVVTLADRKAAVDATAELNKEAAPKIITWLNRANNLVPVKAENIKKVHLIYIGYSDGIFKNSVQRAKEEFEAHGATVTVSEGLNGEAHMKQIAEENDLIVYFAHIGSHAPLGLGSFYNEKARWFLDVLTYGAEKSICVSTGSHFVYNDWFPFAENFISLATGHATIIKTLVKGIYGECEFTGKCPFGIDPVEIFMGK